MVLSIITFFTVSQDEFYGVEIAGLEFNIESFISLLGYIIWI